VQHKRINELHQLAFLDAAVLVLDADAIGGNVSTSSDMMPVVDAERRFSALFQQTYGALRRYAHHRGLSGADADDLVADVFTVAWRKLAVVPSDDPLPWLFAVARNHWRNHMRKTARERALVLRLAPDPDVPEPEIADISASAIHAALAKLSDNDREILTLIAWDDLEPHQAAIVLGCSASAARVRLHRARNRLAAELETLGPHATGPEQQEVHDGRTH
jgi:RNA polymerase sigma-70 factor (ECF subfamily)